MGATFGAAIMDGGITDEAVKVYGEGRCSLDSVS
jgi:hypothetical protein